MIARKPADDCKRLQLFSILKLRGGHYKSDIIITLLEASVR